MALTAEQICTLARQVSKVRGFTSQSGQLLNSILSDLCQTYDLDLAKKVYNFTFSGATTAIGNLNAQLASGPFKLPVDYLRAKIGDVLFFPNGLGNFPLKLTPIDIAEFDALVQQAGFQNYPVFWATDVSQAAPVLTTTGNTHTSTTLNGLGSVNGVAAGNGVAGPGISPGTTVSAVNTGLVTSGSTTLGSPIITGIGSLLGVLPGDDMSATPFPAGTVVLTLDSASQITVSQNATVSVGAPLTFIYQVPYVTLSQAALSSVTGGSFFFGVPPAAYVWPPAGGSYPCMVRYYSQMPDITTPETSTQIPWFPNAEYLRKKLAAGLMELAGDDRHIAMDQEARLVLDGYLKLKDDNTNRSQRVTLDQRRFGTAWNSLPKSKKFGY